MWDGAQGKRSVVTPHGALTAPFHVSWPRYPDRCHAALPPAPHPARTTEVEKGCLLGPRAAAPRGLRSPLPGGHALCTCGARCRRAKSGKEPIACSARVVPRPLYRPVCLPPPPHPRGNTASIGGLAPTPQTGWSGWGLGEDGANLTLQGRQWRRPGTQHALLVPFAFSSLIPSLFLPGDRPPRPRLCPSEPGLSSLPAFVPAGPRSAAAGLDGGFLRPLWHFQF